MGNAAGSFGGNVPKQLAKNPLWNVVGFDLSRKSQLSHARGQAPVPADDPFHQAKVGKVIDAPGLAIPLAGGIDEGEIPGRSCRQKMFLEGSCQGLGMGRPYEPARGDGLAIANEGNGLGDMAF